MATVVYPQNIIQPNPWANIGQGIGVLGDVLGKVIAKYQDTQLLDQHLADAQQRFAAGDPTGLMEVLSRVRTPEARQQVTDVMNLNPQPIYQPNLESGQVEKVGTLPAGAKLLPQDVAARQMKLEDQRYDKALMQEEKRDDRTQARIESRERTAAAEAVRRQESQQKHEIFMAKLSQTHALDRMNLEELRQKNANERDLKKGSANAIYHYNNLIREIEEGARKEAKDAMQTIGALNPGLLKETLADIRTRADHQKNLLKTTYGPLFSAQGFNVPGVTDNKEAAGETRTYQGKQYKVIIKNGIPGIDTSQPIN